MTAFKLFNGKISIGDREISLPHSISDTLIYDGLIIVKIEPPAGIIFNRNIFALSNRGDVFWQIQESPHGTQKDKPYIDIFINKAGALIAANWNGVSYSVNPKNGEITVDAFEK